MSLLRRLRAWAWPCYFCAGAGWTHCNICDGSGMIGADYCRLCVKGVARCTCPLGEPFAQVILTATDGSPVVIDRRTLDAMFEAYGIGTAELAAELQATKET